MAIANMTIARAFRGCSLLLMLAAIGCRPPAAPRSNTEALPSGHEYRPRPTPDSSANDEETGRPRPRRGRPQEHGLPGQFDFYLLNLSWSPEFCAAHRDSPECGRHLGFVVHGLWPQDNNGDYPQHCGDMPGPLDPEAHTDIFPTAALVQHEWETHGACSGLSADDYFAEIHKAYRAVKIPADIGSGSDPAGVTPGNLLARFAAANPAYPPESFALSCGNNRLTAVEICLTRDLRPETCEAVRSCRANVVKVTPR